MKKCFLFCITFLLIGSAGFTQLTGIKSIPGDYATVAAAIAALNTSGVGAGGVTFNIAAGYIETFTAPDNGLITAANSLAANQIVFQKLGEGDNPVITAASGIGNFDYVFCIGATDYVIFDGINIRDNPLNTNIAAQMEWGFALLRASQTDGTQHTIIRNSTINLNRTNFSSCGIYVGRNYYLNPATLYNATSVEGTNSANGFYNLTISNCFNGMWLYGSSDVAPYLFYDRNNDIGSLGANTITDFGAAGGSSNGIYTQYQNNLTVANTTINGTVDGNGCDGMEFQLTSNANFTLYGNTISIQYIGTGTFFGIKNWMGTACTNNSVAVHHNTITGCTFPRAANSTCTYMDISQGAPNVSIYDNTITNNTYGSDTTSSKGSVTYLVALSYPSVLGTIDIFNNTVSNNTRLQSPSGTGGTTTYLNIGYQCNTLNCHGNVVDNNISTTNGVAQGIVCYAIRPVTKNVYGNSVTNLYNANGITYGIYMDGGYDWNLYKNKVQNIIGPGSASTITGIYLGSLTGAGNIYIYNNTIGDLKTSASVSTDAVRGMWLFGWNSNIAGLYNNTIFLNASSSGTNFGTSGLSLSKMCKVIDMRNNIIVNTSTPNGTGKTTVIRTDSLPFGHLAPTSNNNNYFAGIPSANKLIFYDGITGDSTLLHYKSRVNPREYLSVTENSPFISSVTPVDLRLRAGIATQCESGGSIVSIPVSITDDFDGNPRYPNPGYPVHPSYPANAPDIGADEFGGIPADFTPPFISYAPFANIATTDDRILTTTITDVHGVPVSGTGLPRLCWKKNFDGVWTYVTGTSTGNNQYTFIFGGGTSLGDTVYYFVVAQDLWVTPNIGSNPFTGASGYAANPPAATIPLALSNKYVVVAPVCGTFNVGAGGTYTTLSAAINDINTKGITCPVTLVLTDNTYPSETYPITLQPNGGSSAINTLTIRPNTGVHPVFAALSPANGLIKVNGFDYLIIDGSSNGGTDKGLTLYNASETAGAHVIGLFSRGSVDPATHVTIKNCIIRGISSTVVKNYGILLNPNGGGYDDIVIEGDSIYGANTGIQFTGTFGGTNHNGQITNNVIGSPVLSKHITVKGILLQFSDNTLISGNNIMGAETGNALPLHAGVYILGGSTNTKIRKNLIHDFWRNVDDGSGAYGIWYEAESSTVTEISNNAIYGIKSSGAAPGASPNNPYGIFIRSGGNVKILHNSIWLYGNLLSPSEMYDASSACIGIYQNGALTNNIEIRNNILKNTMLGLNGGPCSRTGKTYGIMTTASDAGNFSIIDYNDYYIMGCTPQIGFMNFTNYPSLSFWQTATGQEAHSLMVDPLFTSETNLFPTVTTMPKAGSYISTITSDINGILRTNPPDMGAYEFTPGPVLITTAATNVLVNTATVNGTVNAAGTNVSLFFDYGTTTGYGSTVAGTPAMASGNTLQVIGAALTGLNGNTTYHYRLRGSTFGGLTIYGNDMTFTTTCIAPVITISGSTSVCAGSTGNVYTTQAGNTNYSWTVSAGGTITAGAGTSAITVSWITAGTASLSVTYTGANGCFPAGPGNHTVTVNAQAGPAGSITGPNAVSPGQNGVIYSIVPIINATGYIWNLPSGASIATGANSANITVDFSPTATSGSISVSGTNVCGNGEASPHLHITVIPATLIIQNITVGEGETNCYNALQTIYVAGGGTTFTVYNGGSATMIAGQNIIYYPGTTVNLGGNMHGYITANGQYCSIPLNPLVNTMPEASDIKTTAPEIAAFQSVRVYPNPASQSFTLELMQSDENGMKKVELYALNGVKVLVQDLHGEQKHIFNVETLRQGIYFIKVTTSSSILTVKLIKL